MSNYTNNDNNTIGVRWLNFDGGGFAERCQVASGTTVGQLFSEKMGGIDYRGYNIRVKTDPVDRDYVLRDGDCVVVTARKIAGA